MSSKPLIRSNDPVEVRELISKLQEKGYHVKRPTGHQIKVGPVNYYHSTGTITIDPCTVCQERGAQAFLNQIEAGIRTEHYSMEPISSR